jgi:hypothetical protein
MYHIVEPPFNLHVFTKSVPLGFNGPIDSDVEATHPPSPDQWADGDETPQGAVLGVATTNCKVFQVFESDRECRNEGFESLGTNYEFRK